ncbi:MAG: LytTR family transcriptional regulator [Flavobacteriales bacterium]|nr:LytTR family transcriptional regulator [Flavobacteriales bacterium]
MAKALSGQGTSKLAIPTKDGLLFLEHDNVVCLTAEGRYTRVQCQDGSSHLVCENLHDLELQLPPARFHRCHRSHLLNLAKVSQLFRHGGHRAKLITGLVVLVSRRHWAALLAAMQGT